eukprot:3073609-Alexandrium_andersonii.AAC.1
MCIRDRSKPRQRAEWSKSLESSKSRRPPTAWPSSGGAVLRAAPPGPGAETWGGSPTVNGAQAFERT